MILGGLNVNVNRPEMTRATPPRFFVAPRLRCVVSFAGVPADRKVAEGYDATGHRQIGDNKNTRANGADSEVDKVSDKSAVRYSINQVSDSTRKDECDRGKKRE